MKHTIMKRIVIPFVLLFGIHGLQAQVRGVVVDKSGELVAGARITVAEDPARHTLSETDGTFYLDARIGEHVVVTLSDQASALFELDAEEQRLQLSEVAASVHTGMNVKNELSRTQAISTISADRIEEFNSNNVWQSMYGTLPGLTVLQQVGWNAAPTLYVRGGGTLSTMTPLVIVDGFPRSASTLSASEIESISVLKDGAATALYGSQGANGVIVITTKRGSYRSMNATVDYKFGLGLLTDMPQFVDAATFAQATNEALLNDGLAARYTEAEIEAYRSGAYSDLYPNVDWLKEGLRDFTTNHQVGVTFDGGGNNIRYYTHVDFQHDMGPLANTDLNSKYSTQMRINKLSARINLDIDVTKSTLVSLGLYGLLQESHRPSGDGSQVSNLYRIPANAFPVRTSSGMWGGNDLYGYNPVANIADVGYFNAYTRQLQSNLRLRQDLSMWVKGLSAEVSVAWDNMASYQEGNRNTYEYEVNVPVMNPSTGDILDIMTSTKGEKTALSYWSSLAAQQMNAAIDARINYDQTFGRHDLFATALYRQESVVPMGRNATRKYQSMMLYAGYSYAGKYFVDVVSNYYGSSVLLDGHRFTWYPAVSAAWVLSNESFLKRSKAVDLLKVRASFGQSGYNGFGYELDRAYYVSGQGYFFTSANTPPVYGLKEDALPMTTLRNQVGTKLNVGVDATLFDRLSLTADLFRERRSRILLSTGSLYSTVLGITPPQDYNGVVDSRGFDGSVMWNDRIGDFKYNIGGTFSFARTSIVKNNEGPLAYDYLSRIGHRLGQFFGLEAIGFFADQTDIDTSPQQLFSEVKPGDIKYKDQNGDQVIDSYDMVPMGYSTTMPEIYYGINVGVEWKGLGLNLQFQGTGNYSKVLNTAGLYRPLSNNANLSEWYWSENVRWTEQTKTTATLPRLSTLNNANNTTANSLWLVDASYFTLRNAYLYYNLPQRWCTKMHLKGFQIYLRGENLFRLDHIQYSNPDHIGAFYPELMMLYAGLNIKF